MNPKRETGIAVIAAAVMAVIMLLILCSCRTKTVTLTEYVNIHDTVTSVRTDTVREIKVTHHTDTVMQLERHTYTVNNAGDTIKEIHHYTNIEKVVVIDSTERYKAVVDSLRQALHEQQSKEQVIIKKDSVPWWWKAVFVLAMLALCVIVLRFGKKKFYDKT